MNQFIKLTFEIICVFSTYIVDFDKAYQLFKSVIDQAAFVAVDGEFTGILHNYPHYLASAHLLL